MELTVDIDATKILMVFFQAQNVLKLSDCLQYIVYTCLNSDHMHIFLLGEVQFDMRNMRIFRSNVD